MTQRTRHVLVGTDFSEPSDQALDRAIELAGETHAAIDLVHVLEPGAEEFPFGLTTYGSDRGGVVAYIERELSARADRVTKAGLPCTTALIEGQAAAEIVQRAKDAGADLIVVGTHGRRGIAHAMLGSVAERIVRRATCPVLTVPFISRAA